MHDTVRCTVEPYPLSKRQFWKRLCHTSNHLPRRCGKTLCWRCTGQDGWPRVYKDHHRLRNLETQLLNITKDNNWTCKPYSKVRILLLGSTPQIHRETKEPIDLEGKSLHLPGTVHQTAVYRNFSFVAVVNEDKFVGGILLFYRTYRTGPGMTMMS